MMETKQMVSIVWATVMSIGMITAMICSLGWRQGLFVILVVLIATSPAFYVAFF